MDNVNERAPLVDTGRLTISTKFAYALGHVFNDLAAAMWFSYTLIYLQRVALLEPIVAGALLLLGKYQISFHVVAIINDY
jgi:Na+/melibiose symporter-like transporter